ncbi:MAG: hypothetical protein PHW25_21175 [Zoogloea sp.]|uniref:GumC family protein n=1 Tax=Zoogloea sp. TaxID=49181 RepID=UPI002604657B|nr:hypothetical protein [Zoogloea sp.]MDD3329598.1 hypothetical protein [Zoogloea sp.]
MNPLSSLRSYLELDVTPDLDGEAATRRSNRRRLRVFLLVFALVLIPGLLWNFLRPAEYMATARVQITPGGALPQQQAAQPGAPAEGGGSGWAETELLTQVQKLTSRPLLEKVAETLRTQGHPLPDGDAPVQLQEMIRAVPVNGTEVVELQAIGTRPEQLAAALNGLVEASRGEMKTSYDAAATESLAQARREAERLGREVRERRAQLEAFRGQNELLSPEREENDAVARLKGLSASLNTATEKTAVADARLRALRETAASGKGSLSLKDDPALAGLVQQGMQIRDQIREMERVYTPAFMEMDPRARSLRARLAETERLIEAQRVNGLQTAQVAAQEELSQARKTVEQLQAQIAAQKAGLQKFSSRFTQAKSLEEDLAQLERASRQAMERAARLEASERSREPVYTLLESAHVPRAPFRPDYLLDGTIVFGVAFGLGLLAMWFVELFHRQAPARAPAATTTVIVPPQWAPPGSHPGAAALPGMAAAVGGMLPAGGPAAMLAAAPQPLPRELGQDEAAALLAAAGEARFAVALLLLGLTTEELVALREADLPADGARLQVGGPARRVLALPAWLAACRPAPTGAPDAPLLRDASGAPLCAADVDSMLTCAALDAGLAGAASISAEALRHTGIAWLVRQGLRFSELAGLVGRPSAEALAGYADLAPDGPKRGLAEIEPLMPALRQG